MSDILVQGVKMPKDNAEMIEIAIFGDGKGLQTGESVQCEDGKFYYTLCASEKPIEAIEVPPHRRLIDEQWLKDAMITTLEALKKNPKMDKQEMHLIAAFDTLRVMVEDAPTIIPASEEGE